MFGDDKLFDDEKAIENRVPVITIKLPQKGKESFKIESHIIYFEVCQSYESIESLELVIEDNMLTLQNSPLLYLGVTILASIRHSTEKKDISLIEAEVVSIDNSYGDIRKIKIVATSKYYRLSRTTHSGTYLNLTASSIVKKIAKRHSLSCDVDATSKKYKLMVQINETDYAFVERLALANDYRIMMKGKKLCFKKASYYKKGKVHELDSGFHFLDCSVKESATNLLYSVEVSGFDIKKKKKFSALVNSGKEKQSIKGTLGSKEVFSKFKNLKTELLITDADPEDKEDAKIMATSLINKYNMSYMTGHATIHGYPSMGLDSLLDLQKFGTKRDGQYFIREIRHIVSEGFYTTEVKFHRNVYNTKKNKEFIEAKTKAVKDMKL